MYAHHELPSVRKAGLSHHNKSELWMEAFLLPLLGGRGHVRANPGRSIEHISPKAQCAQKLHLRSDQHWKGGERESARGYGGCLSSRTHITCKTWLGSRQRGGQAVTLCILWRAVTSRLTVSRRTWPSILSVTSSGVCHVCWNPGEPMTLCSTPILPCHRKYSCSHHIALFNNPVEPISPNCLAS